MLLEIIVVGCALGLFVIMVVLMISVMSSRDFLLTKVPEGEIKVIMRGDSISRYISNIRGYSVLETGEVVPANDRNRVRRSPHNAILFRLFGVEFIGIPPLWSVLRYNFQWNKYSKPDSGSAYIVESRAEEVSSLFMRSNYAIIVDGAETEGKIPLRILLLITTQVTNAHTALFLNKRPDWLAKVTASVKSATRDYTGSVDLNDITRAQNEGHTIPAGTDPVVTKFGSCIMNLNRSSAGSNSSLSVLAGVEIIAVNFISYDVDGPIAEELNKVTVLEVTAKEKAKATIIDAEAKAQAIKKVADADKERLEKTYGVISSMPHGHAIRMAEAIENTKVTTLVLGNAVQPTLPLNSKGGTDE